MKTYTFMFSALPADFRDGWVSVIIGGSAPPAPRTVKEMTWPEAQEFFPKYRDMAKAPAMVYMGCVSNPKPRGFNKACTSMEKRDEGN